MLPYDVARCVGKGAGPSGHQLVMECVNCQRRTAPWGGYQVVTEPPSEFPCPNRIPATEAKCPRCGLPQSECDFQKNLPDPEPFL